MRRMRFNRIDFRREARWLLLLAVGLPALAILLALILPAVVGR